MTLEWSCRLLWHVNHSCTNRKWTCGENAVLARWMNGTAVPHSFNRHSLLHVFICDFSRVKGNSIDCYHVKSYMPFCCLYICIHTYLCRPLVPPFVAVPWPLTSVPFPVWSVCFVSFDRMPLLLKETHSLHICMHCVLADVRSMYVNWSMHNLSHCKHFSLVCTTHLPPPSPTGYQDLQWMVDRMGCVWVYHPVLLCCS